MGTSKEELGKDASSQKHKHRQTKAGVGTVADSFNWIALCSNEDPLTTTPGPRRPRAASQETLPKNDGSKLSTAASTTKSGGGSQDEGKMLREEYDEIVEKILKKSDEIALTMHGVFFKEGVTNLDLFEQFKYLEYVKRGGGGGGESWDVYVRKVPLQAHEIAPNVSTEDYGRWKMSASDALGALGDAGVLPLTTCSSQKDGNVRGDDVKAQVDWGVFPSIGGEVTPYRGIFEMEVKNLYLKEMIERLVDHMIC